MTETIQKDEKYQPYNILDGKSIGIDDKFIIKFNEKNNNDEASRECKVLKFACGWSDILTFIESIKSEEYPNVFIIVIEADKITEKRDDTENLRRFEDLEEILSRKFGETRPLVVQLTSLDENTTNFYYKEKYSNNLTKIDQNEKNFEKFLNFPTFLCSLMSGEIKNFEDIVIEKLPQVENFTLILRFLDAKSDINEGFSRKVTKYLEGIVVDASAYEAIQKLPLEHKIKLSTAAFEVNELNILCDLMEVVNLPFPKNFNLNLFNHERLKSIVDKIIELQNAINSDDKQRIRDFCKSNPKLKKAFLLNNKTALCEAIHSRKMIASLELKSSNFETAEGENAKFESLNIPDRLIRQANEENKENAISHSESSLLAIKKKSKIHNYIDEKMQGKYELDIEEWCKDINESKYGKLLLDVVTLCEKLKIFFNFESESVSIFKLIVNQEPVARYILR